MKPHHAFWKLRAILFVLDISGTMTVNHKVLKENAPFSLHCTETKLPLIYVRKHPKI